MLDIFLAFVLFALSAPHNLSPSLGDPLLLFELLLLLLSLHGGFDSEVPLFEFGDNLLFAWNWSLHPGVSQDLRHRGPVGGVELEHALDELLELFGEEGLLTWLIFAVGPPEDVGSVGCQAPVEGVVWLGGSERRVLGDHDEQNYCGGEQVHGLTLVWLLQVDLGSHVVQGTQLGVEVASTVSALDWCGEAKVSDFESVVAIEKQILWLEVSVSKALLMAVVKTIHEFLEIVSGDWLFESARNGNEVKEFSTEGQLQYDV